MTSIQLPLFGGGTVGGPEKKSLRRRRDRGETYTIIEDRGEQVPRCNGCGEVVHLRVWFTHVCSGRGVP